MPTSQTSALILGTYWTSVGQPTSLSCSIFGPNGSSAVNAQFASAVTLAAAAWNSVANVGLYFVPNTQAADISFIPGHLDDDTVGLTEYTLSGDRFDSGVIITMDDQYFTPAEYLPDPDNFGFEVLMHELGHALGLSHPNDGSSLSGGMISGNGATMDGTIMGTTAAEYGTYTLAGGIPVTPMIYDIAAMQYLYGANTSYNADDTTYVLTGAVVSMTIWDGGGTDTLECSTISSAVSIDLREGLSNVTRALDSRVWNAFGANIENARGGSGNDTLYGSSLNNLLTGNDGNDTISGANGDDSINGNLGSDSVSGESGDDSVRGGKSEDTVYGNAGNDLVFGDRENDSVRGGDGNDVLHGGKADDLLFGEAGADTLMGELGNDTLTGGAGNDVFVFGEDSGVDVISDFSTGDLLQISSAIFANTLQAAAATLLSGGNATVDLGDGNSVTITGVIAFGAGDFVIA